VGAGTKRSGKLGRVETAQDRAAKRTSARLEARGKHGDSSPAGAAAPTVKQPVLSDDGAADSAVPEQKEEK